MVLTARHAPTRAPVLIKRRARRADAAASDIAVRNAVGVTRAVVFAAGVAVAF